MLIVSKTRRLWREFIDGFCVLTARQFSAPWRAPRSDHC